MEEGFGLTLRLNVSTKNGPDLSSLTVSVSVNSYLLFKVWSTRKPDKFYYFTRSPNIKSVKTECCNHKLSMKKKIIFGFFFNKDGSIFIERKCGLERPTEWGGMDIDWPYKRRDLGDEIVYHCPNNKLTWEESLDSQSVRCIWHRQSDTMMWWPQNLKQCNSEYFKRLVLYLNDP